jgi:hypothetical protein
LLVLHEPLRYSLLAQLTCEHWMQPAWPPLSWYCPAAQSVQAVAAAAEDFPDAQSVQVASDVAAVAAEDVPAAQSVQITAAAADHLPASQSVQLLPPAASNLPAAQLLTRTVRGIGNGTGSQ